VLWNQTNQRFSNHPLNMCSSMSFGEPFDARMRTSASYSFGNCSRNDAKLVYDQARRRSPARRLHRVPPQEIQKCAVGVTPGPQAPYAIKGFFGPKPPVTHEKAPSAFMGTDARDSAELREMKAQDLFPPVVIHG